jgi:hypothetical protein
MSITTLGAVTTSSDMTAVTTDATPNTKGSYTEFTASLAADADGVCMVLRPDVLAATCPCNATFRCAAQPKGQT